MRVSARRTFSQMAAELHHHRGVGIRQGGARARLPASVAGSTTNTSSPCAIGAPAERPAAGHGGDARHDLGPVARREPHVQMHVGAVEQRIALAEHRDGAAGIEMARDRGGGGVVEIADGVAVATPRSSDLGRHRIEQRQLLDAGAQMLRRRSCARCWRCRPWRNARRRRPRRAFAQPSSVSSSGSPGPDADADQTPAS